MLAQAGAVAINLVHHRGEPYGNEMPVKIFLSYS